MQRYQVVERHDVDYVGDLFYEVIDTWKHNVVVSWWITFSYAYDVCDTLNAVR